MYIKSEKILDSKPIKSYLLPIFVNEQDIETSVIKEANQLISVKFGNNKLLDMTNFLGGATIDDWSLKAYKISETKGFYPTSGRITPTISRRRSSTI